MSSSVCARGKRRRRLGVAVLLAHAGRCRSAASPASSTPKPGVEAERGGVQAHQAVRDASGTCRRRTRARVGRDALGEQRARSVDHLARGAARERRAAGSARPGPPRRAATPHGRTGSSSCPCRPRPGSTAGRRVRRGGPLLGVERIEPHARIAVIEHVFQNQGQPPDGAHATVQGSLFAPRPRWVATHLGQGTPPGPVCVPPHSLRPSSGGCDRCGGRGSRTARNCLGRRSSCYEARETSGSSPAGAGASDPAGAETATRRQTSVVSSLPQAGQQATPSPTSSPQTKQTTSLVSGITKAMRLMRSVPAVEYDHLRHDHRQGQVGPQRGAVPPCSSPSARPSPGTATRRPRAAGGPPVRQCRGTARPPLRWG